MKIKLLSLLLFFFSNYIFSQVKAKVIGIKDGDTVVVLIGNNIQKTLRLAEVDCPESKQPFGKNAKQFTSEQVFGKTVDFFETDTDRYGRAIAKIYYDNGKYLSEEIIRKGFGWWYFIYSNNKNLSIFESQAKYLKLGLWADKNSIAPWEWRIINKKKL